jgi:hypothetical protein
MLKEIASLAAEIAIDRYKEGMIESNMYSQLIVALLDMQDSVMDGLAKRKKRKKTVKKR